MTTYCINPNETWLAVYTLNTGTMPTNNVVFSEITANLTANATSITVKTGEGTLFTQWMIATLEQLQADWKTATAREVVLISWISWDTLTLTRWYENCVMDDTASPKVLWNTKQAFTSWARISVYVSRALLNGVQTRLSQVNCPCNTSVYNQAIAMDTCLNNCCDKWWSKLYDKLAENCGYRCCVFWNGCDWDLIVNSSTADECWYYYLCANKEYQFNNLTIEEWYTVRFEKQWVARIRVRNCFINNWVIDLRWWECTGCCSYIDDITWTTISNLSYDRWPRCWWQSRCWWAVGCPWSDNCWWDWWKTTDCQWTAADWFNWGHWGCWPRWWNPPAWWGWGWWGWWRYWNWGTWWTWWCNTYQSWPNYWWDWGNASYWWIWWTWWYPWHWYSWAWWWGWNWWNGYIWWEAWPNTDDWAGTGGCWVIKWWKWWWGCYDTYAWWRWGNAVNNTFWLFLSARIFDNSNWIICSKWWDWWEWWNWVWYGCDCRYTSNWWPWWNGADWGCSIIIYWNKFNQGCIDNRWWACWLWWCPNSSYSDWRNRRVADGCAGTNWSCKICQFTY